MLGLAAPVRRGLITAEQQPLFNFKIEQFAHWRAAVARVRAGTGRGRVLGLGPSNMRGWGTGIGGNYQMDARRHGWFYKTAGLLAMLGIPAQAEGFMGAGNGTGISGGLEAALATGNWTFASTTNGPGGRSYSRTTATSVIALTPNGSFDTVEVYDQMDTGKGSWQWAFGAAAYSASISGAGAAALRKTTCSSGAAAAAQTFNINKVGGAIVNIQGWIPYDSAVPALDFVNMGWPSSSYANWTTPGTAGYTPLGGLAAMSPDLIIIQMGLQEFLTVASPQLIIDGIVTIAAHARSIGADVLVVTPFPPNGAGSASPWAGYVDAFYQAAGLADVPVLDMTTIFKQWNSALVYDGVHYLEVSNFRAAEQVALALRMAAA